MFQEKEDAGSHHGSDTSDKSDLGSETSSLEERPVKSDKDLTIYEILERKAATQTVIDILRDEEDFKVGFISTRFPKSRINLTFLFLTW